MGKCREGVEIPFDEPCPVCGATDNDTCGRWAHRMGEVEDALESVFPELGKPITAEAIRKAAESLKTATAFGGR